jgi:hypothetical protein
MSQPRPTDEANVGTGSDYVDSLIRAIRSMNVENGKRFWTAIMATPFAELPGLKDVPIRDLFYSCQSRREGLRDEST